MRWIIMRHDSDILRRVPTLLLLLMLAGGTASAIVIRHDRSDDDYRELGARYPAVARVLPDGTGVLVHPRWVLTAAHVAQLADRHQLLVEISGRQIGVDRVVMHPDWRAGGPHDIGLLELASEIEEVEPVELYADTDEVGSQIVFVGGGDFGTGREGPQRMSEVIRGATNEVDEATPEWLLFSFTEPPAGTDLEGVSGPGDSGGPALLQREGRTWVVGVSVAADGQVGRYGVTEIYSRVSSYRDWLIAVMASGGGEAGQASGRPRSRPGVD